MFKHIKRLSLSLAALLGFAASVLQILGIASIGVLLKKLPQGSAGAAFWGYAAAASLVVVLVGLLVTFIMAASKALKQPRRPFDITEEYFHFKIRQNDIVHTSKYVVKNRAAGHWAFPYRYYWSGTTTPTLRVISPPGASFFESGREMQWTVGQIVFPVDILKGKEIVVEVEQISTDTDYQNFVSRIPQEKIEKLTLEITLDNGAQLSDVAQLILETPHDASTRTGVPADRSRSQANHHLWTTKDPKPGKQYMLAWK